MLTAAPIQMISAPNFFSQLVEWQIIGGNSANIWFQLQVSDAIGTRRWIPAPGASVSVEFLRARTLQVQGGVSSIPPTSQTFTKPATQLPDDRSMWSVNLLPADTSKIVSGSVVFVITEGANVTTFIVPYMIKRTLTSPGC